MTDAVERLRDLIERERERFSVPGCAVVVVRDGEVLFAEGFGRRSVAADLPVTADTLFPIGSSTKTFTAAVCAALVDQGKVDLDQPLREILPGFRLQDPIASELLSLRDCLSHRSGLPRHDLVWYAGEKHLTRDDLVRMLAHLPPTKPFRQTWQYNNLLFTTAGHVAGKLSGGSYEDAVRSLILDPLGMSRTNFRIADSERDGDHARPYVLKDDDALVEVPFAHIDLVGPAGCINSSVAELAPWLLTLLGKGVDGRAPLLSDLVLNEMRTPTMPLPAGALVSDSSNAVGYGLALVVEDYRGNRVVHHGGNIDGFSSQVAEVPDEGIGVAVLTNLGGTPMRDVVPYLVFDELLGLDPRPHGEQHFARWQAARKGALQGKAAHAAANKPLPAVRPPADYVGRYVHPGYGAVDVVDDGGLRASYFDVAGVLEHRHLEVFDLVATAGGEENRIPAQFTHDLQGEVDALQLLLEPQLPPLRFARQPDTSALTPLLLDRLAGTYALDALELVVSRRGEQELLIAVAGGGPQPLTPVSGTTFALASERVEFTEEGRLLSSFGEFTKR